MLSLSQPELKVFALVAVRYLFNIFQVNATRYLVRVQFSSGEIPMMSWFQLETLRAMSFSQFLSLAAIASFTLVSFPLGIWISSFGAGMSYGLNNILITAIGMFTFPLQLWTLQQTVGEVIFNSQTKTGIAVLEVSSLIGVYGWWLVFSGNRSS